MRNLRWITPVVLLVTIARAADMDMSSPKAAVKSFYSAVERVDTTAVRQILYVENDPQEDMAGAYGKVILGSKRLGDIAKKKFPGVANQLAQGTISPEDAARIDTATITMSPKGAVMKIVGRPEPIELRQVNGNWRVLVGQGAGAADSSPKHRADRLALLQSLYETMNQLADEINADKYPTIQDAEAAVKQRLGAVVAKALQADIPTTKPAN